MTNENMKRPPRHHTLDIFGKCSECMQGPQLMSLECVGRDEFLHPRHQENFANITCTRLGHQKWTKETCVLCEYDALKAELEKRAAYIESLESLNSRFSTENTALKAKLALVGPLVEAAENVEPGRVVEHLYDWDSWSCCGGRETAEQGGGHRFDCWWVKLDTALAEYKAVEETK